MFRRFKNASKRNLDDLTNAELTDLGEEFTEEGERALSLLQSRQKDLISIYQKAYTEFEGKNYFMSAKYLNTYVSLAEKYNAVVTSAVFDLFIAIAKETDRPEAVLSLYDNAIAYYTQVANADNVERFKQGKEYYKASLK